MRQPLKGADIAEDQPGHSALRGAEEEAVGKIPGDPAEAIITEPAHRKDARL